MDVKEAEKILAKCMKEEYDFYFKHIEPLVKSATRLKDSVIVIPENIQQEFEELQSDTNLCGDELASYPELFDVVRCWMIDICGEGYKGKLPDDFSSIDIEEFFDQYGNLAHLVSHFVKDNGFNITDRGGGESGWQIGVPCNEVDARKLCTLLHDQFAKAIKLELISVYKRFWGNRLPNLYNWDTLEEWLKINNLEDED